MLARLLPALFALAGTVVQMRLSLHQLSDTHGEAIQRKGAEDDLVKELPAWKRRKARRDFVRDREPDLHNKIKETWMHLWSWAFLSSAAAAVVVNELFQI